MSKTDGMLLIYSAEHIRVKAYLIAPFSNDSDGYTDERGEGESPMELEYDRKSTRVAAQARGIETAAVTAFQASSSLDRQNGMQRQPRTKVAPASLCCR